MEDVWRRSGHGGVVKEEKRGDSASDEEGRKQEVVVKVGNKSPYHENDNMKPSSPKEKDSKKDSSCDKQVPIVTNLERSSMEPDSIVSSSSRKEQDDQLESARAEMGEAREENQRLKMYLNRIMKDYQTLQTQFHVIVQQESKKSTDTAKSHQEIEESELVSLSLGRFSSDSRKDEKNKSPSQENKADEKNKEGLSLGLDCKFEVSKSEDANEPMPNASSGNSLEESKEEAGETWPPSKILKTMRSGDDDISQQNPTKRARVSVRARCDTPTMNDGCQWRKYGQKIAKGNPCPRAYYRCTIAPSCPVRKQVQRFVDDMSILITTYEGTHNHPLPMSATAMASTTSAAASVLLSGSSSSSLPGSGPLATTTANLDGLNFYLSDNTKSRQFYLPNSSLYSSPSTPTITLDLTSTPSSLSSPFNRFSSNYPPRYDPTSLNFGSSSESNSISWGNGFLSYGTQPHIKNQIGTLNLGRQQPIENIYQSYMQKNPNTPPQQSLPADTIAAATKAITTDPSFQSALAAALTSIIGNGSSGSSANQGGGGGPGGDNFGQKLKWDHETFQVASSYSPTTKGNGCASSYLMSKSSSTSSQPGSLTFLPPSFPFSTSKSASASPVDNREHTN